MFPDDLGHAYSALYGYGYYEDNYEDNENYEDKPELVYSASSAKGFASFKPRFSPPKAPINLDIDVVKKAIPDVDVQQRLKNLTQVINWDMAVDSPPMTNNVYLKLADDGNELIPNMTMISRDLEIVIAGIGEADPALKKQMTDAASAFFEVDPDKVLDTADLVEGMDNAGGLSLDRLTSFNKKGAGTDPGKVDFISNITSKIGAMQLPNLYKIFTDTFRNDVMNLDYSRPKTSGDFTLLQATAIQNQRKTAMKMITAHNEEFPDNLLELQDFVPIEPRTDAPNYAKLQTDQPIPFYISPKNNKKTKYVPQTDKEIQNYEMMQAEDSADSFGYFENIIDMLNTSGKPYGKMNKAERLEHDKMTKNSRFLLAETSSTHPTFEDVDGNLTTPHNGLTIEGSPTRAEMLSGKKELPQNPHYRMEAYTQLIAATPEELKQLKDMKHPAFTEYQAIAKKVLGADQDFDLSNMNPTQDKLMLDYMKNWLVPDDPKLRSSVDYTGVDEFNPRTWKQAGADNFELARLHYKDNPRFYKTAVALGGTALGLHLGHEKFKDRMKQKQARCYENCFPPMLELYADNPDMLKNAGYASTDITWDTSNNMDAAKLKALVDASKYGDQMCTTANLVAYRTVAHPVTDDAMSPNAGCHRFCEFCEKDDSFGAMWDEDIRRGAIKVGDAVGGGLKEVGGWTAAFAEAMGGVGGDFMKGIFGGLGSAFWYIGGFILAVIMYKVFQATRET